MKTSKLILLCILLLYPGLMGSIMALLEYNTPLGIWFYFCLLPSFVLSVFLGKQKEKDKAEDSNK
jgi:hypothetical protein